MKAKFATAINCIDGRIQTPIIAFIRQKYDIDYIDMITMPGPDKILSEYEDIDEIKSIKKKVLISCNIHNSKLIFVVGHCGCAGNTCGKTSHLQQIRNAKQNVKKWNVNAEVHGLWVDKKQKAFLV